MTEAILFVVGSVVFVITAGASVTFGMFRAHELQRADLESSQRVSDVEETTFTEIHRTQRLPGEPDPAVSGG